MPLRTCVGCRAVRPQSALIRIARDAAGRLAADPARWRGRGAYVCGAACLEQALTRRVLSRALGLAPPGLDAAALGRALSAALERRASGTTSTQRGAGGHAGPRDAGRRAGGL